MLKSYFLETLKSVLDSSILHYCQSRSYSKNFKWTHELNEDLLLQVMFHLSKKRRDKWVHELLEILLGRIPSKIHP